VQCERIARSNLGLLGGRSAQPYEPLAEIRALANIPGDLSRADRGEYARQVLKQTAFGGLSMFQDVSRLHAEPSQRVDVCLRDRLDCFIRTKC
jgi:hypothetical protein